MSEVAGWNYSMTVKLNVYKGFPKVSNKPKELVLTIYNESGFLFFFLLIRVLIETGANGKEIFQIYVILNGQRFFKKSQKENQMD